MGNDVSCETSPKCSTGNILGTLYIVVRPLARHKLHIAFIKGHEKHQILTISALIKVENLHRLGV